MLEGGGSVQGGQGTRSRGRTRFYYTHIESSGRPADSSRRTTCSALFPLVCHTVSWFISLLSVFLLHSAFHFCLIIIIPYEIIRGYILLCCAVQCSYYSHLFGFPALRLSFAPCESSCLCLRLYLWSLLPVPRQGTLILFCCLPTLYINLIFPLLPSLWSADVFFFYFFLVLGLLRGVSSPSPPPFLLR